MPFGIKRYNKLFTAGNSATIILDDVCLALAKMAAKSVHMAVSSPPYWMQRDYGFSNQIGREARPIDYAANVKNIFDHLHRIVRDDGTVWLNMGDKVVDGHVSGIPWLIVDAVREAGWHLSAEIIWHKPNAMTETANGRPSRNHEYIFMFSKIGCLYFYDRHGYTEVANDQVKGDPRQLRRLARSVWTINNQSTKVPHYAAFPVELPERCIRLGTSEGGCCRDCGAPFMRNVEKDRVPTRPGKDNKYVDEDGVRESDDKIGNKDTRRHVTFFETLGWKRTCKCKLTTHVPCTVLDFFSGIGRTGVACDRTGRSYIGIEYKSEYAAHFHGEVVRDRILREKRRWKESCNDSVKPKLVLPPGWSQKDLYDYVDRLRSGA